MRLCRQSGTRGQTAHRPRREPNATEKKMNEIIPDDILLQSQLVLCKGLSQVFCIHLMVVSLGVLVGVPTVGVGVVSLTLLSKLGTLFLLLDCPSSLDRRVCVQSYCILLCCVHLISLGSLLFSEGKWRESGSGGEGILEMVLGGVKGGCDRDVIQERRMKYIFQDPFTEERSYSLLLPLVS